MGIERALLQQRRDRRAGVSEDHVGRERNQFGGVIAHGFGIAVGPPAFELDVPAEGPSRLLETLRERLEAGLRFRIVWRETHQHADAAHTIARLPARLERPGNRRAAEKSDELASMYHGEFSAYLLEEYPTRSD